MPFELNKRDTELYPCFKLQRHCGRPRKPASLQMQPVCAILPESQRMAPALVLLTGETWIFLKSWIVLSCLGTGTLVVGSKQLTSSCVTEKSEACNFWGMYKKCRQRFLLASWKTVYPIRSSPVLSVCSWHLRELPAGELLAAAKSCVFFIWQWQGRQYKGLQNPKESCWKRKAASLGIQKSWSCSGVR